jgi:hypothetical protein
MKDPRWKCLIVAIAVAGSACASSSGGIPPSKPPAVGEAALTPAAKRNTRITRILVNADCTATIDDETLVGKPGKKIGWLVEDAGCSAGSKWRVELQFESDWNNGHDRIVKINPDDFRAIRVHPNTPPTPPEGGHKYKVYLVYPKAGTDTRIPVIDPEVDIAM